MGAVMRAAIYARRSSDLQRQVSTTDQTRRCRDCAKARGWQVAEEHIYTDEAMSGALTESRPAYQQMLGDAKARAFDVLLTDELSRLTRDNAEALRLERRLRFWGVGLVAIANGIDTVMSPKTGKTLVAVNGIASEAEREMNAERQRRSLAGYVLRGMHAGGAPFGFRSRPIIQGGDGPEGTGRVVGHELVVHEAEAEVVKRVFRLFAEGKSSRQIANLLNAEGVPPPGARWKNRTTRVARTWSHTAIASSPKRGLGIVNNPKYVGRVVWNRTTWPQDPDTERQVSRPVPREEWVEKEIPSLRIVPQDLWEQVKRRQELQRAPRHGALVQKNRDRRLLSGLLKCHECGSNYVLVSRTSYRCGGRNSRGESVCKNHLTVSAPAAEEAVLRMVRDELYGRRLVEEMKRHVSAQVIEQAKRSRKTDTGQKRLRAELAEIEAGMERLVAAIRDGALPPGGLSSIGTEMSRLEARKERCEAELAGSPEKQAAEWDALLSSVPAAVEAFVDNLRELLAEGDIALVKRRLAEVVQEIVVEPDKGGRQRGGKPRAQLRVKGCLPRVLALAAEKCKTGGSPGGIRTLGLLVENQIS